MLYVSMGQRHSMYSLVASEQYRKIDCHIAKGLQLCQEEYVISHGYQGHFIQHPVGYTEDHHSQYAKLQARSTFEYACLNMTRGVH